MDWVLLVVALLVILAGAELFTNGVEWVGEGFGLSEGAVGSVLAAIGTALPETILPLIAVLFGAEAGAQIGVGAILGSPFMLSTLAMCLLGASILAYARAGRRPRRIAADPGGAILDLGVFMTLYSLAVVAGVLHVKAVDVGLAVVLVGAYGWYVRRHFGRDLGSVVAFVEQCLRRRDGAFGLSHCRWCLPCARWRHPSRPCARWRQDARRCAGAVCRDPGA